MNGSPWNTCTYCEPLFAPATCIKGTQNTIHRLICHTYTILCGLLTGGVLSSKTNALSHVVFSVRNRIEVHKYLSVGVSHSSILHWYDSKAGCAVALTYMVRTLLFIRAHTLPCPLLAAWTTRLCCGAMTTPRSCTHTAQSRVVLSTYPPFSSVRTARQKTLLQHSMSVLLYGCRRS